MTRRVFLLVGGAVVVAGTVTFAGVHRYKSRARLVNGIPPRDYIWRDKSPSIIGTTFGSTALYPSILRSSLTVDTQDGPIRFEPNSNMRYFPSRFVSLSVGHCMVSDLGVVLESDGHYVLSLKAEQNPEVRPPEPGLVNLPDSRRLAEIRNQFFIRIRAIGQVDRSGATNNAVSNGNPVLFTIESEPFWVETDQPHLLGRRSIDPMVGKWFSMISYLEVEFYYR